MALLTWIYYNWPSKFMQKENAEIEIKNNQKKEKQMESLLKLGAILGKMIISIAKAARKENEKKENNEETPEEQESVPKKEYKPKAIYGILYPSRGFLEAHTDAHQGWILSISVGASANFWYSNQQKIA